MALYTDSIVDAIGCTDSITTEKTKSLLIANASSLTETRVRVTFSAPALINDALTNVASYTFGGGPAGSAEIVPLEVKLPIGQVSPTFVEIETTEHVQSFTPYTVKLSSALRGVAGEIGNPVAANYLGKGIRPAVEVVIATSPTTVEVHFTEPIRDDVASNAATNWRWQTVDIQTIAVEGVDGNVVTLRTTPQEAGELYVFFLPQMIPAVLDLAGNAVLLDPTPTFPVLGYQELAAQIEPRALQLKMYGFLIESIREEDQKRGDRFLERLLEGPQRAWDRTDRSIRSLPDLWSAPRCPDQALAFQKWIVGWTPQYDRITDELDAPTLRRLIAASVPFWKRRGAEDALPEILRLTTGARTRVWGWFDLRFVLDETELGEDHQGRDSWMMAESGAPDCPESQTNLRIVDDGALNRRLVRNFAKLTRQGGERLTISYLAFLDLFTTDGDASQWAATAWENARPVPAVANGAMTVVSLTLGYNDVAYVNVPGASSWQNYVCTVRVRGRSIGIEAYRTGPNDKFFIEVSLTQIKFRAYVGGNVSGAQVVSLGFTRDPTLYYCVRVELVPEGSQTRIRALVDGALLLSVLNGSHVAGTIGLTGNNYEAGLAAPLDVDEVEVFFNPMEEDVVGINS